MEFQIASFHFIFQVFPVLRIYYLPGFVFDLFQLEPLATKYKKGDKLFIVEDFTKGKYKPGGICIVRKAKENETYDVKMIIAGNIRRNVTVDLLTLPVPGIITKRNSIPTNFFKTCCYVSKFHFTLNPSLGH